ncbi:MAG: glutaminase A [Clostridium sp.]|nr:glutaminase A [Clostridium sp.]
MKKLLNDIIYKVDKEALKGKTAAYIPELKEKNKKDFGLAIMDVEGREEGSGMYLKEFTIQSISKSIVYLYILESLGYEKIKELIDLEPSGEAFNSFKLKKMEDRFVAYNPMVNTGAIIATSLVPGSSLDEKYNGIIDFTKKLLGKQNIKIDYKVYISEKKTGVNNYKIGKMLKEKNLIKDDIKDVLDLYFKQCSLLVSGRDLAFFGAVLANNGVNPKTNVRLVREENIKYLKVAMLFSGLYDYSGNFLLKTGLIAKSGVGGGIVAFSPSKMGIGSFGPSLDIYGNSEKGISALEKLSKSLNLSII